MDAKFSSVTHAALEPLYRESEMAGDWAPHVAGCPNLDANPATYLAKIWQRSTGNIESQASVRLRGNLLEQCVHNERRGCGVMRALRTLVGRHPLGTAAAKTTSLAVGGGPAD